MDQVQPDQRIGVAKFPDLTEFFARADEKAEWPATGIAKIAPDQSGRGDQTEDEMADKKQNEKYQDEGPADDQERKFGHEPRENVNRGHQNNGFDHGKKQFYPLHENEGIVEVEEVEDDGVKDQQDDEGRPLVALDVIQAPEPDQQGQGEGAENRQEVRGQEDKFAHYLMN
jgi:hypothetical protein